MTTHTILTLERAGFTLVNEHILVNAVGTRHRMLRRWWSPTRSAGRRLPLVYVRVAPWDNPDCDLVRDAFLTQYGHLVDYHEITVDGTNVARWWDDNVAGKTMHGPDEGFTDANRRFGARHISGVRGEESRIRGMVMARWGEAGPGACRPHRPVDGGGRVRVPAPSRPARAPRLCHVRWWRV